MFNWKPWGFRRISKHRHNLLIVLVIILIYDVSHCTARRGRVSVRLSKEICNQLQNFSKSEKLQPALKNGKNFPEITPCKVVLWNDCQIAGGTDCEKFQTENSDHCTESRSGNKMPPEPKEDLPEPPAGAKGRIMIPTGEKKGDPFALGQESRIVGGRNAKPNEFPYQVRIAYRSGKTFCGGAIYNENYVLSAAHCFYNRTNIIGTKVVFGDHIASKDEGTEQVRTIKKCIVHSKYSPIELGNDIALIQVSSPIQFNKYARPPLFPPEDFPVKGFGTVSGWGRTKEDGSNANILQWAKLPIVPRNVCKDLYKKVRRLVFSDSMICAGLVNVGGQDACQGDSGGPFTQKMPNGSYVLVGIVSFGIGCARAKYPGVYTEVSQFRRWISSQISPQILAKSTTSKTKKRIVGGTDAYSNEFPFVVHFTSSEGVTFCGGSILNEMYILTAAHCFELGENYGMVTVAGDHDVMKEEGTEQILYVEQIITHEGFNRRTKENDIALVELKKPVKFNHAVGKVHMPEKSREGQDLLKGMVTVVGWGLLEDNWEELQPDVLQKVNVPLVSWEECKNIYTGKYMIPKSTICAGFVGEGGKDSCRGDSGGPLMKRIGPGNFVLVGIVSFGSECASKKYPGVYTDVAKFLNWIDEHMPKKSK